MSQEAESDGNIKITIKISTLWCEYTTTAKTQASIYIQKVTKKKFELIQNQNSSGEYTARRKNNGRCEAKVFNTKKS
jgi:hypothetical protein